MKLTKQKLEQLIMEEYKSMSRRIFDKRREFPEGGLTRAFGDEDQPINRPEYHDKLTALGSSGPEGFQQAKDLADALGEPLDVEVDPSNMKTFSIQQGRDVHMDNELWFDYVMMGYADNFEDEIDIDKFSAFVAERGIEEDEMEEVYEKLNSERLNLLQKLYVNAPKTEVERRKELEKLYDLDLRPDWMKKSSYN